MAPGDSIAYLHSLEQFGIKFGLHNIEAIVTALDHPERAFAAVHVAGTNGKGSVTAMVEAVLRAAGFRTGRYTSPHLRALVERIAVDGQSVSAEALADAVEHVRAAVDALRARGTLVASPTFFEVTTAAAFELFRQARVDIAVCEVGLGGRLDATNVLSPVVTAITSIGLDHQRYLGNTLADIAAEKAGIIKPGVPVVLGAMDDAADEVISNVARLRHAPVIRAREGATATGRPTPRREPQSVEIETDARRYGLVEVGLAGAHQIGNALVAIRVIEQLDSRGWHVPTEAVARGLATVRWRGRLERIRVGAERELLLDAAHNPAGAEALARFLAGEEKHPLVFAAMTDKDAAGVLRALAASVSGVVFTRASHPRSEDPDVLAALAAEIAPGLPVTVDQSPRGALEVAWRGSPSIVVAGSIFLLGDVMEALDLS